LSSLCSMLQWWVALTYDLLYRSSQNDLDLVGEGETSKKAHRCFLCPPPLK
jgi:hypothetical protein